MYMNCHNSSLKESLPIIAFSARATGDSGIGNSFSDDFFPSDKVFSLSVFVRERLIVATGLILLN